MSLTPAVSVVMSVYNGAPKLEKTIRSILAQTFTDFEFVVVNDGSTDASLDILNRLQKEDRRVRVIDQPNAGLTRALNTGCMAARGDIIVRQDVGDISLPTRIEVQVKYLHMNPRVVAVGVASRRIGPAGEVLGEHSRPIEPETITRELTENGLGLLHASSAFRREAFFAVGGYRPEFRFAQDTDLWLRIIEYGLLAEVPEVLFEVDIETAGISAQRIDQQVLLWNIARECFRARQEGVSESALLARAGEISASHVAAVDPRTRRVQELRAEYFIGSQLFSLRDSRCRRYLWNASKVPSLRARALGKFLLSYMRFSRQVD